MPTAGEGARKRVCSRTFVHCEITSQSNIYIEDRLREQAKDSHVHVLHHITKQPKVVADAIVGLRREKLKQHLSPTHCSTGADREVATQAKKGGKGLIRMTL